MAKITRQKVDIHEEKNLVTGCIVSTDFISHIAPILNDLTLLKEAHNRTIVGWCVDYYKRYGEAPGNIIQDIFVSERKHITNEDTHDAISNVLEHLNKRYIEEADTYDATYYVTKAKDYIEERAVEGLADRLKGLISQGKTKDALKELANFNKVDKVITTGVDPYNDPNIVEDMFSTLENGIMNIPFPALKEMLKDFYRGDVVAVAGPAKRGKSYLMSQLGYWALKAGLNVGVFSFEMENKITALRFFQNVLGETKKAMEEPKPIAYFDKENNIQFKDYQKQGINPDKIKRHIERAKKYGHMGKIRLFDSKSCGRRVSDIVAACNNVERYEGFKLDVIVVDYDALLENEYGFTGDPREKNTQIWKDLKAKLAQDLNMLVITGSQYGRDAIKNDSGVENTAENIRKFDYVSHWITINQNQLEKKNGLMRLDVVGRHDEFNSVDKVVCIQALGIGRPILDARWVSQVGNYDDFSKVEEKTEGTAKKKKPPSKEAGTFN